MSDDVEETNGGSERNRTHTSRRRALKLLGGGLLAASGVRVGYEVTGYGTISGTNLTEQRLAPLARETFRPRSFDLGVQDGRLIFDGEILAYEEDGRTQVSVAVRESSPDDAAESGDEHGVGAPFRELTADIGTVAAGEMEFEFSGVEAFFERIDAARPRPYTVAALRGDEYDPPKPETLREFAGSGPDDPASLVTGLAEGFRDHAHFDVARWVVLNTEDHVLLNTVPLSQFVSDPTGFEELSSGSTGLYCWEYTLRSIEAFHAAPPHEQSRPVFGAVVTDDRHNHMFTGLASVVRDGDSLVVPMTFIDYSHSTMYDSYGLRWALGPGVDAYNEDHRASGIRYTW